MFKRFAVATAVALVGTAAAQTVTVDLVSSVDGTTIAPGATVDWQIDFSVSSGDNAGLALLIADLNQDAGNPETLDLPPASGVPGAMSNFSRPDGISNPGEGTPTTGYPGVQRGTPGALNLVQIGGAQNTFGVAQAGGTGIAENATLDAGVGQSGTETLASGSFAAPATNGTYILTIDNVQGNVLTSIATLPNPSPVAAASVNVTSPSITFTVGAAGCGANCDVAGGDADVDDDCDVDLTDLANVLANFGQASASHVDGDTDFDGDVDLTDLANILARFGVSCP